MEARGLECAALAFLVPWLLAGTARAEGYLHVVSFPTGEVVVDGVPTGRRTPTPDLAVRSGAHTVRVRFGHGGRLAEAQRVEVADGDTTYLYFRERVPTNEREGACGRGDELACWELAFEPLARGNRAVSEARLRAYLARFPRGRYAPVARSVLAGAAEPASPVPTGGPFAGVLVALSFATALAVMVRRLWKRR